MASQRSSSGPQQFSPFPRESAIDEAEENEEAGLFARSVGPSTLQGRRRRSSVAQKWNSIKQMGGVNSLDNFSRSFQRAANFREIASSRRGSVVVSPLADGQAPPRTQFPTTNRKSVLAQQLSQSADSHPSTSTVTATETTGLLRPSLGTTRRSSSPHTRRRLSESLIENGYGSISSKLSPVAQHRASVLVEEQIKAAQRAQESSKEYDPELQDRRIHVTEEDGEIVARVIGDSTVPMTIFNSVNSLVGVGLLALPLAMSYTGWVIGIVLFVATALTTQYTAILLSKCLDTNTGSMTYGDIAYLAFGPWGRRGIEAVFLLELTVAGTGLIVLFADSMHSLLSDVSILVWQVVIAIGLLPLNFAPFRILSITSILGIFCTVGIIILVFTDGFIKPDQPGSLRQVAQTDVFPSSFRAVPLSIGLFMAPWGGHSVFPAIYRDMRHPQNFKNATRISYGASFVLDVIVAVIGYLMFGDGVDDEVTSGILKSKYYPAAISIMILFLIALVPTTKLPLINRPIMDTVASKFESRLEDPGHDDAAAEKRGKYGRYGAAILSNVFQLGIAILFPNFDSIMALLGSAFCISISVILPACFYLRIFAKGENHISLAERILCYLLIVVGIVLAILGTLWAILPKEQLGIKTP